MIFGLFSSEKVKKLLKDAQNAYKEGKRDEAINLYKQVLKLDKDNEDAKESLKTIYREKETLRAVFTITEKVAQQKPTEAFKNIGSSQTEIKADDRRLFKRVEDKRYVDFRLLKKSEVISITEGKALDKNISAGGLLLLLEEDLPLGTFLELKFEYPDGSVVYTIGKVVRKEEIKEGDKTYFGLGIKFTNISAEDQKRIDEMIKQQK